jgi:hypothetical protein
MATTTVRQDKDANAKLDYLFSWEAFVDPDADSIASATVSCPSGLACTGTAITASTVRVFVSGGAEGRTYDIVNRVFTTGGRTEDKVLQLTIVQVPSATQSIVVETGSASPTSNSYASVADGNAYHASHLYASAWHQANDAQKEKALIWATRLIDENVEWTGFQSQDGQALQWPRHGAGDRGGFVIDSNEIPRALKDATAEMARLMLGEDRTAEDDTRGFSMIKAGSVTVNIDKSDRTDIIPKTVARMVSPFGRALSAGQLKLIRA